RARAHRRRSETLNVLCRIDRAAFFVDEQTVVTGRAEFSRLIGFRYEGDDVTEDAREQRLLCLERANVARLGGSLQMSRALELAIDSLVGDEPLEDGHGIF